ncbi:sodium/potassium/calcium exchanger 4-like isoform X2 [Maniola jurtina]|uniref:sodium/potassium/calcium exchanger 4-like isoform X2 n=1 Tax=Maniola jurtina TaxID=191418 RepID=UPI001E68A0F2|nr:sodium/potassium/calcium exchanger 4-like isoform X2 [Maniola jurtina]
MVYHSVFVVLTIWISISSNAALEDFNATGDDSDYLTVLNDRGETVYITRELLNKLIDEAGTWHWKPWLRTKTEMLGNIIQEVERIAQDSVEHFPDSIFTDEQLRQGAFLCYVMFGIYSFTLLAIVCNDYFIPCVEMICEDLKIPQNVAAATFMSVATSCPEFFVNVISTFLTQSDMGIGTIVGSAIFNLLGVAAIGSLAAVTPIAIDFRPVTRDVIIYMMTVGVLVAIVWDGQVVWYEALVLGILYICYFIFIFNSMKIFDLIERLFMACKQKGPSNDTVNTANTANTVTTISKSIEEITEEKDINNTESQVNEISSNGKPVIDHKEEAVVKPKKSVFRFPKENSMTYRIWWVYTWPLKLLLSATIPSPMTYRRIYPLSFLMCIIWIGVNSYLISWSMTVIGHTFYIPESVMGMTFLAFGGCLPEACSIFIMSRRGEGGIGVSNALGANTLAILFALGLPWLIKTLTLLVQGYDTAVTINSAGIDFIVGSLLVAACCLWIALYIGKFKLRRSVGFLLAALYLIFITFAILVEMGIILDREGF